jgi:endonuclease-3
MPRERPSAKTARVRRIIAALRRAHPDAKLALNFSTPLELLVALILAAQSRDAAVNALTEQLFQKYRSAEDWMKLREEDINRINFYRNKTRAIRGAARALVEKFGGAVPGTLDELLTLPGVGRKTGNAVLANAFGQPAIVVDTHTWRLAQRLGLTVKDEQDAIEADLVNIVPRKDWTKFCHLLQFHGRRVCAARRPNCPACSINKLCPKIGVKQK